MIGRTDNLSPTLTGVLIRLEHYMGFDLTINSGYRDPQHNVDVGGVEKSEHTNDPADGADVLCVRSQTRFKMLKWLFEQGITRIGIGRNFLHIGVDTTQPQQVCWHYYPTRKKGG